MESSVKRKFIGLSGGLSKRGRQDNSIVVSILEKEFGFFRTSPLDSVEKFSKKIGALTSVKNEIEKWSVINRVCISGMKTDEEMWMNLSLKDVPKDKRLILVDDIFFEEEASLLRSFGGVIIRIVYQNGINVIPNFEPNIVIEKKNDSEIADSFRDIFIGLQKSNLV